MISVTEKTKLVEQLISETEVPWNVQKTHKAIRKITNGNFISVIYANTDKGTKWVSVQENKCPDTITVKSNYIEGRKDIINDIRSVERFFTKIIERDSQQGKIEVYQFYKYHNSYSLT